MSVIRLICAVCKGELHMLSLEPQQGTIPSFTSEVPFCTVCSQRAIDAAYNEGYEEGQAE